MSASALDLEPIRELGLLTAKPFIYVFNVDDGVLGDSDRLAELAALVAPAKAIFLDAKLESELIDLSPEDAAELLASTGQQESGLGQLARVGFGTLGLRLAAGAPATISAWRRVCHSLGRVRLRAGAPTSQGGADWCWARHGRVIPRSQSRLLSCADN